MIPLAFQLYRAPHDAIWAHKIFKLFVPVGDVFRNFTALDMIVFQNFVDRVLGDGAVIVQGGVAFFAGYGRGHIGEGLRKGVVVVFFAVSYLLVEPTHMRASLFV